MRFLAFIMAIAAIALHGCKKDGEESGKKNKEDGEETEVKAQGKAVAGKGTASGTKSHADN